ncbi:MAG: serine/threonine protein kinase, partial [Chloroflexi bacterium]|nr:serine/threonine protein kinase [Chloroflexota bacterium]
MTNRKLGKYEVLERLGRGGMAEVYRAYHASLDRYVAIKVLHAFLADDPEFKNRFEREAQNIAKLRHPNIVQVYDFDYDEEGGSYYMVMELISGITLKDRINELEQRGQFLDIAEVLRIVREAASALAYAHSRSMMHRDVKPANLMIDHENRVVLTDFGIAKIVTGAQFTVSGGMVGTPAYMAPEQGMGEAGDERSDLYSLGAIFYHLTTGKLPYDGETPLAVILKHLNEPIPRPSVINPSVPESVELIITKLMAKRPEDRYQSAVALIADLERVERGEALSIEKSVRDSTQLGAASIMDTLILPPESTETAREESPAATPPTLPRRSSSSGWFAGGLIAVLLIVVGLLAVAAANGLFAGLSLFASATPTASETVSPSPSATVTFEPTTLVPTEPTAEATAQVAVTIANTTAAPTATASATSTASRTPTRVATATPTPTFTATTSTTPTFTATASPTRTPTLTATASPTSTRTATTSPTPTRTPTRTPTPTR